jgi:hypothetical protein
VLTRVGASRRAARGPGEPTTRPEVDASRWTDWSLGSDELHARLDRLEPDEGRDRRNPSAPVLVVNADPS